MALESTSAPAGTLIPVGPAPAPGAALLGPGPATALTPQVVLALQRTAGNRSVSRMLARTPRLESRRPQNLPKFTPSERKKLERLQARMQAYGLTWEDVFSGPEEIERIFAERKGKTAAAIQVLFDRVEEARARRGVADVPGVRDDPRRIRGTSVRTSRSEQSRHRSRLDETRKHHGLPEYLGGLRKQTLIKLREATHYLYHEELDRIEGLPRRAGSAYYRRMTPAERDAVCERLLDHARRFDAQHHKEYLNPDDRLADAIERGLREARAADAAKAAAGPKGKGGAGGPPTVPARPTSPAEPPPLPSRGAGSSHEPLPTVPNRSIEGGLGPGPAKPARPARRASVGVPSEFPPASGHSPRGEAIGQGVVIVLQGANFILNAINDERQGERARQALAAREPEIARLRTQSPTSGVLVIVYFRQSQGHPDSPLQPGAIFERVEVSSGRDERAAWRALAETPTLRSAVPPNSSEFITQQHWIEAIEPAAPAPPAPPLPTVGLATFASSKAVLQDVEWSNLEGFDDEGQTTLVIPPGMTPRFHVLELPDEIGSVIPRRTRSDLQRTRVPKAVRGGFPAVRLDPTLPFTDVVAVALFPADQPTLELFLQARSTRQLGPLLVRDFDLVRWARPEQLVRLDRHTPEP